MVQRRAVKRKGERAISTGQMLQTVRERKNLSREDAAKQIGVSSGYLKTIERKGTRPSIARCQDLARVYGVDVKELVASFHPNADLDELREPPPVRVSPAPVPTQSFNVDAVLGDLIGLTYEMHKSNELLLMTMINFRDGIFDKGQTALLDFLERLGKHQATVMRIFQAAGSGGATSVRRTANRER